MVCSRMIKLYTTVIPDYGGIVFYITEICFSSKTHSTDYLHEATLIEKSNQKKKHQKNWKRKETFPAFKTEGQYLACIILEVVKM